MTKISIVIPVYNVENYIEECLESILSQTFQDFEVICINDGSTDSSGNILDEFSQKDSRIKVFHCENKGAAQARNYGFTKAIGNYVLFFDSDDFLSERNCLELFYKKATESDADITICKSQRLNQTTGELKALESVIREEFLNDKTVFSPRDISKHIFQFCIGWPWDKLYKRDFIQNNNLIFQDLRQSNDTFFVLFSLTKANKIATISNILITHRYHNNSLAATRVKKPECFYLALKKLFNELKNSKNYKNFEQSFINYCTTFPLWHIESIKDEASKKVMIKLCKKLAKEIKIKTFNQEYFYDLEKYQKFNFYINQNPIKQKFYLIKYKLFKNEEDLFNYYQDKYYTKLHKILEKKDEKIFLWGASMFLEDFLKKSKIKNKNILGIIDKNSDKEGQKIGNYIIFSPEVLKRKDVDKIVLTTKNHNEIIFKDIKQYLEIKHPEISLIPNIFL